MLLNCSVVFIFKTEFYMKTKTSLNHENQLLVRCCYVQSILNTLSNVVEMKRLPNNFKVFISKVCPFCGEKGKRVFRYNSKLKVGKSYCCGASFKELTQLKEKLRYVQWHKDKLSMNYSRFVKVDLIDDYDLPF